MFGRNFFKRLMIEWNIHRLEKLIARHQDVKDRFIELTAVTNSDDPMHMHRISKYADLMCQYERDMAEYGYTP